MRQHELQTPASWINSRHKPAEKQEYEPAISQEAWDEIISRQNDADTAMAGCLFLGGMLIMILMVLYIMFVNHLIIW